MRTIDVEFFPHIADALFTFAPSDSLLVMKLVCSAWRARADAALSGHIALESKWIGRGTPSQLIRLALVSTRDPRCRVEDWVCAPWGNIHRSHPQARRCGLLQAAIRVIDIDKDSAAEFAMLHQYFSHGSPGAEPTVRFADLWREPYSSPLDAGAVVLFANGERSTPAAEYLSCVEGMMLRHRAKTVFHIRRPQRCLESRRKPLSDVTVFVHPWDDGSFATNMKDAVERNLGTVLDLVHSAQATAERIIVVGLEELIPESLGLRRLRTSELIEAFRGALAGMTRDDDYSPRASPGFWNRRRKVLSREPLFKRAFMAKRMTQKGACPVTFMTGAEYRKKVGHEQYDIETKQGPLQLNG